MKKPILSQRAMPEGHAGSESRDMSQGRALGIKLADFEPEKAVRRGPTGANGIEKANSEPESDAGRVCGLRNAGFEPGRALERGAGGVFGLRYGEIEPGKPAGSARGIKMTDFEPGSHR